MQPQTASVPDWVRIIICITAAATVPGMIVAACFKVPLSVGVAGAIGWFAVQSAKLAFKAEKGEDQSPQESPKT